MKRFTILAAILGLAVMLDIAGFATGAVFLFAAAALVEGGFWVALRRKPRPVRIAVKRDDARRRYR